MMNTPINKTMNKNRSKLVSIDRAIALIDCYGANTQAWPVDERVAAIALIQASTQLQQRLQEARQLDDALNGYDDPTQDHHPVLASRIIDQLPAQEPSGQIPTEIRPTEPDPTDKGSAEQSNRSFSPTHAHVNKFAWQKKSMIAAGVALFFVSYALIQSQTTPLKPTTLIAQPILDQWMMEEITIDTVVDNNNNENNDDEELTFMALVELEI